MGHSTTTEAGQTSHGETSRPRVSLEELPPVETTHWVVGRKAIVVHAVMDNVISADDACARYGLSTEEFESWYRLVERHGTPGLRCTRLQEYRDASRRV